MTIGKTDDFGPSDIASCENNATDGKDLILRGYVNGILMETNKRQLTWPLGDLGT